MANPVSQQRRPHKRKNGALLAAAGFGNGQHALDKKPTVIGVRAMRGAAPDDRMTERSFGSVVGGLDAWRRDEGPGNRRLHGGIQGDQAATGFGRAVTRAEQTLR